jgi:hypothetical protein
MQAGAIMSHRQAKRIRKSMFFAQSDLRASTYDMPRMNVRLIDKGELDTNGKPVNTRFLYTGTLKLNPNCARAQYQSIKRGRV